MITDIEDYFAKGCGRCSRFDTADCATNIWASGLLALRRICQQTGLDETLKWGHPCYACNGRNIAIIGAFRGDFCISFMNAALLQDAEKLLEKPGPNSRHPSMIRFTDPQQVAQLQPLLLAYLNEATEYAKAGLKPPQETSELTLPDELIDALDLDPELAAAFDTLTPGRQRSYVINLNAAKAPATRITRIARFRDKILAGKGAMER